MSPILSEEERDAPGEQCTDAGTHIPRSPQAQHSAGPRERPILFSGPMVRALLAGTKTQTRRIVKPRSPVSLFAVEADGSPMWTDGYILDPGNADWRMRDNPYGQPDDSLWVKETWKPHSIYAHLKPSEIPDSKVFYAADEGYAPSNTKWWPSLFMQRRFSRLTLKITEVRVERLQDISEEDALAEGIQRYSDGFHWEPNAGWPGEPAGMESARLVGRTAAQAYMGLWEDINGRESLDANPWVWAVSFERVTPHVAPNQSQEGL